MSSDQIGSAKIQASSPKPSIDLATLVELLAKSIPTKENRTNITSLDPVYKQAFDFDSQKQQLRLCSSAVLRRLFRLSDFKEAFNPEEGSGFIQDLELSGFGTKSLVGGNLTEKSTVRLSAAVDKLIAAIDQELEAALPQENSLSTLLLDQPIKQLQQLAKNTGAYFQHKPQTANLVPIAFPDAEAKINIKNKSVAKVILAREQIDADDYFERMCSAVRDYVQNQLDWDEDDIEAAIDSLRAERDRTDSQLTRFLNFLDDEALARVRQTITLRIMEAIAQYSPTNSQPKHQLLAEYVHRVSNLLTSATEVGYSVDLTDGFGVGAEFDLSEYLNKATFYYCLPVWAEWETQIFEEKTRNQQGTSYGVVREVSYRFRINGNNPEQQKSAFLARLDKIEEELKTDDKTVAQNPWRVCRRLAELIFLRIVIPLKDEEGISAEALPNFVEKIITEMKTSSKTDIQQVIADLRKRESSMQTIASSLIDVLKTKGEKVISQVQKQSSQQFICVKRSIIEWSRLEGAESGVRDLLKSSPQTSRENVEWFKHIEICNTPETPGLLFSVHVTTDISEHDLVTKGDSYPIQAQRLLTQKLLQIIWVPRSFSFNKEEKQWKYELSPNAGHVGEWTLPAAVIIDYDAELLNRNKQKRDEKNKQYHAAAVAAFTVLVYCCLWRIIDKLNQSRKSDFTTLMLRLQEQGKTTDETSGDNYVYAAAQTLEAILAEDTNIRMQGVILDNLAKQNKSTKFIKGNIFNALLSAFPLAISTPVPPEVPKIGLISYATRPCNEAVDLNPEEKGYLFLTQSYTATAVVNPVSGYELKAERIQSDIVDSPEQLKKQRLVQEEIRYLKNQGCEHIILLSHAYRGRRFNRTADYNSALTPKEFLEDVFQTFPDLNIYTMLRDVFPATRLQNRAKGEAAFEILHAADHTNFLHSVETVRVRDVIPVYTFATLFAVQEQERPQSGFCVYFLVSDQRVSDITWTERARQHLVNAEQNSPVNPCLIAVLRGLHFIEAERGQLIPVLDPFRWISPNTVEAAGEVEVLHNRRKGKVYLSYPALLTHISQVLHRRK
ncbi:MULTISPECIES: hypothetical protein [unclassified Nodularia (in: cyanobacteria)]|uniref:hypothetical protein n=1 Tax=unclassified Nodularia (in: cyanobacteria) TaxID=2656917 RepID=UPI0018802745|nr:MULTISPECIES: hypothetical protein [unclassified Nodularia (in: cyanobacteria)]MBE9199362.1 hypothetical protein [Nodularia sp. LEGE 06071]MCC2696011.1 hypothetical protein [Nodularia sp. LEGE 04288]